MSTIAVIPARYGSTRFPGKPLARETGKFLVQHVYEQVTACSRINRAIVATDDPRIADAVGSFGGEAHMTRSDHVSGTDRVAEVAESLRLGGDTIVINVQGDEPEMKPSVLDRLLDRLESEAASGEPVRCRIATPAAGFSDDGPAAGPGSPADPNRVKVVIDLRGRALYFSRSLIPYPRDTAGVIDRPSRWLLHLGVYAFRADALRTVTDKRPRPGSGGLDETESLEQLRWLADGVPLAVEIVDHAFVGVDTPEDYAAFVRRMRDERDSRHLRRGNSKAVVR